MTPKPFHEKKLLHESSAPTYDLIVAKLLRAIAGAPQEVYSPSDDSFLMLDVLSKLSVEGKAVLDVGTGSGILALFCALRGAREQQAISMRKRCVTRRKLLKSSA